MRDRSPKLADPDLSAGRTHVLARDPTANRSLVIGTRPVFEFAAKFVRWATALSNTPAQRSR